MRIQNNIPGLNANRTLKTSAGKVDNHISKLSSGYRVNSAADDAAGLAISEKMRGQIRGLNQAERNIQDGASLIQVADAALQESHNIIQRMRELAVQSASDTNETVIDRAALEMEYQQLMDEVDHIADKTQFNGKFLFSGEFEKEKITDIVIEINGVKPTSGTARDSTIKQVSESTITGSASVSAAKAPPSIGFPETAAATDVKIPTPLSTITVGSASVSTVNIARVGISLSEAEAGTNDAEIDRTAAGLTTYKISSTTAVTVSGNVEYTGLILNNSGSSPLTVNGNNDGRIQSTVSVGVTTTINGTNGKTGQIEINGKAGSAIIGNNNGGQIEIGAIDTFSIGNNYSFYLDAVMSDEHEATIISSKAKVNNIVNNGALSSINITSTIAVGTETNLSGTNSGLISTTSRKVTINANPGSLTATDGTAGSATTINTNSGAIMTAAQKVTINTNSGSVLSNTPLTGTSTLSVTTNTGSIQTTAKTVEIGGNNVTRQITGADGDYIYLGGIQATNSEPGSSLTVAGDNNGPISTRAETVKINGSNPGDLTVNNASSSVTITGTNSGRATITAKRVTVGTSSGQLRVTGADTVTIGTQSGTANISAKNTSVTNDTGATSYTNTSGTVTITTNSGSSSVSDASKTRVTNNNAGLKITRGEVYATYNSAPNGKLELMPGVAVKELPLTPNANSGTVIFRGPLTVSGSSPKIQKPASELDNNGRFELDGTNNIDIRENKGEIIASNATSSVSVNASGGTIEVGGTKIGTATSSVTVATNNGIVRNAGTLKVTGDNTGRIENYGTMTLPIGGTNSGTIQHHVTAIDTSGISVPPVGMMQSELDNLPASTITITANGQDFTITAKWEITGNFDSICDCMTDNSVGGLTRNDCINAQGRYLLTFDMPDFGDGGYVVIDDDLSLQQNGSRYEISNNVDVYGALTGESGRKITFEVDIDVEAVIKKKPNEGLYIQTGANQGDNVEIHIERMGSAVLGLVEHGYTTVSGPPVLAEAAVKAVPGTAAAGSGDFTVSSTEGAVTAAYTGGLIANEARLNGVWDLQVSAGKAVAINQRTGETISKVIPSIEAGKTAELDFGALGKITMWSGSGRAINSESVIGMTGQIVISGAVDKKDAVYEQAEGEVTRCDVCICNTLASSSIKNRDSAAHAISICDGAINMIATRRADLGAWQNRLEHKSEALKISSENLQTSESLIRDLDMAKEMAGLMKDTVLKDAGVALLSQANSLPQGVLQLLG
ncbi:MAG: hypothetical protein LBM98_10885 [Oscillospiraceae bacterium]|jgi:flagellin|nr:hypothetical protein [Oscillospiraceae bacterium]